MFPSIFPSFSAVLSCTSERNGIFPTRTQTDSLRARSPLCDGR